MRLLARIAGLSVIVATFAIPVCRADASITLTVMGLDGVRHEFSADQLAAQPHLSVKVTDHSGSQSLFDGIPARELLRLAGAPLGKELAGMNLLLYVVAEAADGYAAVYALAEFDSAFTDSSILIADRRHGKALSADEGPLRVVVPWEKRQARWVRQLIALRLARPP
jgi:hypothetical protein